jgi:type II secretory pathway pseudopilin PulG
MKSMSGLIKRIRTDEQGFLLVELLIVMVVSLIMLAGMVGLISMGFQSFSSSKNLQALADASRRVLPAMDRQMKPLLHINDDECVANYKVVSPAGVWDGMSFYADVDNDNAGSDVENYTAAEKIEFYKSGDKLMQRTTEPGVGGAVTSTSLCSYVDTVRFYYFPAGIAPGNDSPPANRYQGDSPNGNAGSIKVVIELKKGNMTKTYEQNTFLRVLERD